MNISFPASLADDAPTLVVGLFSDEPDIQLANLGQPASVGRAMAAAGFKAARDTFLLIPAPADSAQTCILLQGLGARGTLTPLDWEKCGGALQSKLADLKMADACFCADDLPADAAARLGFGVILRSYRFDRYKTAPEEKTRPASLAIRCTDTAAAEASHAELLAVGKGVFLARDLVNEPPNVIDPAGFVARTVPELEKLGVKVEIFGPDEMAALGMNALLGVSRGAAAPPRLLVLQWHGADGAEAAPAVMVGKGVTFDSGGISLKPGAGMWDMKFDMGGAAAVVGAMIALAGRKAKANIVAVAALVENMPDGNALRPGDIVTSMSGRTIEVLNTDAEGRLILADAITYAQQRFKPHALIDIATLTGAVLMALGNEYGGLFANDEELAGALLAAGAECGEPLWRLPMSAAFDKMIDSDIADVKNLNTGPPASPGSSIGAQFVARFVNTPRWAHLDIAGTAWSQTGNAIQPRGATGYGVRLLDRWVREVDG